MSVRWNNCNKNSVGVYPHCAVVVEDMRDTEWYKHCLQHSGLNKCPYRKKLLGKTNRQQPRAGTQCLPNAGMQVTEAWPPPVFLFSTLINLFFGCFDPVNILLDNKNKWFSGWPKRYFGWKRSTGRHSISRVWLLKQDVEFATSRITSRKQANADWYKQLCYNEAW